MKCILFSLAVVGSVATTPSTKAKKAALIEPDLDPKSDKKFFGKDYPYDVSHRTKIDVPYPYPVVQASAAYDKDYTKDENHNQKDGTNWELQLKHAKAVSDAAADVERLQAKLAKEKKDVHDATPKKEAEMPDEVGLASKDVEGGVSTLEDCKDKLEAAKKKLQKLQDDALAAEKQVKDAESADEKALKDEQDAEAKAAGLVAVIDAAQSAHEKAEGHLEEEKDKLKDVEAQEKGFEERLRNFRSGPRPTTTEAPPPPVRSGAAAGASLLASAVLAAALAAVNCM